MNPCIIGEQDSFFAASLAARLRLDLYQVTFNHFLSTESTIHFPKKLEIADRSVLVAFQFKRPSGNVTTGINHQLGTLLFLIRYLKTCSPQKITLIAPYLPYGRQEKKKGGEIASLFDVFVSTLRDVGVNSIITCELHKPQKQSDLFHHLSLTDFWADHLTQTLASIDSKEICIVSPDQGGINRAQSLAQKLNANFAFFEKKRTRNNEITMTSFIGDIRHKTVILIDDILDTAQTAARACEILHAQGAGRIIGCFAHGIFSEGSHDRLKKSFFESIFVTNTILHEPHALPPIITSLSMEATLTAFIKKNIDPAAYGEPQCTRHSIAHR